MSVAIHNLTELLRELPGIGPRQARRLALWIAKRDLSWVLKFSKALVHLRKTVHECKTCMRLFEQTGQNAHECSICSSQSREKGTLLITEKDVDVDNIERTGTYKGLYFVLGGTTSPLDKHPEQTVRIRELEKRLVNKDYPISELIFGLSATTEGEDTEIYVRERLATLLGKVKIQTSVLGRGLSTGTELEYVDADTMRNALKSRHSV